MYSKSFFYRDFDGVHYPDSQVGTKYIYGVDFRNYLNQQEGTLVSIDWNLEEGLEDHDEFMHPSIDDIALINLKTPYPGSYTVTCVMTYTSYSAVEQELPVPLIIKVY